MSVFAALVLSMASVSTPAITPETAEQHIVYVRCHERNSEDGEIGTAIRIDETHAITALHVVKDGRMCEADNKSIRIVLEIPNIDFAIIETASHGTAWSWGFDCSPSSDNSYELGGYEDGHIRWFAAQGTSSFYNDIHNAAYVHNQLVIGKGKQLTIGMSGGPTYNTTGALVGINMAATVRDRNTSLIRLLADTPICDKTSQWYRGN